MCLRERPRTTQALSHRNSSNDWEGDVELLVGCDEVWRLFADRSFLANSSPVFEALFLGPLSTNERIIEIPDVDPRAFDILLKFLYRRKFQIQNVRTALNVLYAGHKYLITELVEYCVRYLQEATTVDTILTVFQEARRYNPAISISPPDTPGHDRRAYNPTAPLEEVNRSPVNPGITGWSAVLLSHCFNLIDIHAEIILQQEGIEDLSSVELKEIISRNSLKCSELTLFNTLQRWSECECKRKHLVPTPCNRREVLGDLRYYVRYLRLTSEEFMRGPMQSDLLTAEEIKILSSIISGAPSPFIPPNISRYLTVMKTQRTPPLQDFPPKETKRMESSRLSKPWGKSSKNKTSKHHNSSKMDREGRCSGCFTDAVLDVIVWLFD